MTDSKTRIEDAHWGMFIAEPENNDLQKTLLLIVNAGGGNANFGMPIGLMMGAGFEAVPDYLKCDLSDYDALQDEISSFAEIVISGKGVTAGLEAPLRQV